MPLEPPIPEELLRTEAERIGARYRVSKQDAHRALARAFTADADLAARIWARHGQEDVTRWRDYRDVVRRVRKRLYYELRRYYPPDETADRLVAEFERELAGGAASPRSEELRRELLSVHTSTRERAPHHEEFYEGLFELVGVPVTLLDVGCGMHPLSYPFEGAGSATRRYVALDRDERATRAVKAYAGQIGQERLVAVQADLEEADWADRPLGPETFDVALMLKLVPVLARLSRDAARRLAEVPADRILVTGSAEAMTRRQDIERRERAALRRFIDGSGRKVVGEFRAGDEFGYLAR